MTPDEIREEVDAYDASLVYLDEQVTALLDELARRRVLDDTIVVITSDHGEEFGEHGVFDHGYTLYRQALQVPLVIVGAQRVPSGHRVGASVSLRDVPATIVDVVGLGPGAPFPGNSLTSFWSMPAEIARRSERPSDALLSEVSRVSDQPQWFPASKGAMKGLVHQGFHYIRNGDGREELYDVERDPAELRNLAATEEYQQQLAETRTTLAKVIAGSPNGMK